MTNSYRLIFAATTLFALGMPISDADAQQPKGPAAGAADPAKKSEAETRFKRGYQLYGEGDFPAALNEFRKAYELDPQWGLLYNIAQVYYQLKDYVNAKTFFERYLVEGGSNVDAKRKASVEQEIQSLKGFIATVTISTTVPDVEISIDDVPIGKTPLTAPVTVNSGRRKITASKAGYLPFQRMVDLAGGDNLKLPLELNAVGGAPVGSTTAGGTPPPPPPPPSDSGMTTLSWVGVGATGAFAIGATVTGFMALKASKDLEDKRYFGTSTPSDVSDQQSKVKTLSLTTDVLIGAAVLTGAATLYFTLSRDPKPSTSSASNTNTRIGVGPGALTFSGTF